VSVACHYQLHDTIDVINVRGKFKKSVKTRFIKKLGLFKKTFENVNKKVTLFFTALDVGLGL